MGNRRTGHPKTSSQELLRPPEPSPAQEEIADATADIRAIVQAGPGTGKTETVAHRLLKLLGQGLRPTQILVLSFSRNAVRTLTSRIERQQSIAGGLMEDLRYVTIRTFDSWSFRMLRKLNYPPATLL